MNSLSRSGPKIGLKKVAVLNLVALAVSLMIPAQALATHVSPVLEVDSAGLVKAGSAGGTVLKMYFWVRDNLQGHTSSPAVNTWLEVKTFGTSCADFDGTIVKRIIGGRGGLAVGETFNSGFYYGPYVWDGSDLAGNLMSPGLYCFQFRSYTTDPAGMPMAFPSTPYSDTVTLGVPQAARVSPPAPKAVPISQVLVHNVTGSPITVPGGTARVNYTTYQTIRNGITFKILNSSGAVVTTPGSRSGPILADTTGSFSWNGKDSAGNYVSVGTYTYRFVTVDGVGELVLGQGNIVVQTAPPPPPAMACSDRLDNDGDGRIDLADPGCVNASDNDEVNAVANVAISNISASPSSFSPASVGFTSIQYTLDQPARVSVEIWRGTTLHYTLTAMPGPGLANNGSAGVNNVTNWGGWSTILDRFLNLSSDNGPYEIRVSAIGSNGVLVQRSGSVTISNAVALAIDVSNVTVAPATFDVSSGQTVTVNYTLNNMESNRVYLYVYRGANLLVHRSNVTSGVIGQNQLVWNGFSSFQNRQLNLASDDGTYTVYIDAFGADGSRDFGSSTVTIANSVVSNLAISNISANPSSFSPQNSQTTVITFNASTSGTNASAVFLNATGSVVHTIPLVNIVQGQNQLVWNGYSNNLTRLLSQSGDNGAYTVRIDATGLNGVAVSVSATDLVTISNTTSNLVISSVTANPLSFNPSQGQSTTINFNLSASGRNGSATIVSPNNSNVYTVSLNLSQGANQFAWNGYSTVLGRFLNLSSDNGTYMLRVDAVGSNGIATFSTGPVSIANGSPQASFSLTDQGPSKNQFNPEIESTNLQYTMTHDADVRIRVYSPGTNPTPSSGLTPIRMLLNLSLRSSGPNVQPWNGRDDFGNLVVSSEYPYLVEATSRQDSTTRYFTGYVSVNRISGLTITDLLPSVSTFNPSRGETVTIRFELNQADAPTVAILRGGVTGLVLGNLPITLESSVSGRYVYRAVWSGRDSSGNIVANDTYAYRIRATSAGSTQERVGYVRVDSTGGTGTGGCGGYSDVASNDPLCPAIQFVVNRGIFLGDAGRNTLRLSDKLSRAETSKVLQSAFGYSLEGYDEFRDGDLGFSDLDPSQWYMPYMKTFIIRGVMRGFPDGKMRPVQKMKTTELFKVFVEGVFDAPRALANFTLNRNVRFAPFNDTPVKSDTKWYLPYADFAQRYHLAPSEPYFYPAREITRGKMILLIYESSNKNVVTYGVANPSAKTPAQITFTYGSRSPTYYRSGTSTNYSYDAIY